MAENVNNAPAGEPKSFEFSRSGPAPQPEGYILVTKGFNGEASANGPPPVTTAPSGGVNPATPVSTVQPMSSPAPPPKK
jgi:hypothetical protein